MSHNPEDFRNHNRPPSFTEYSNSRSYPQPGDGRPNAFWESDVVGATDGQWLRDSNRQQNPHKSPWFKRYGIGALIVFALVGLFFIFVIAWVVIEENMNSNEPETSTTDVEETDEMNGTENWTACEWADYYSVEYEYAVVSAENVRYDISQEDDPDILAIYTADHDYLMARAQEMLDEKSYAETACETID